jgi:glutaredoxin
LGVIVYSSENCSYCVKLKAFMQTHGLEYELKDIQSDEDIYKEFRELGAVGTPFTIMKKKENVEWEVLGFNETKLKEYLDINEV